MGKNDGGALGGSSVGWSMADNLFLTFKYKLLPSRHQHEMLTAICESQRILYNVALEERIDAYRKKRETRSFQDQCRALTAWRQQDNDAAALPCKLQRWTLQRLDDAYRAFFRRAKLRKGKAGFPRFRGRGRWNAFGFAEFSGIRFDGKRIRFKGMPGGLRVHMHRPLPDGAQIKACTFRHDAVGWCVNFQILTTAQPARPISKTVGIDLGLKAFAVQSDGTIISNPRIARNAEKELRRRQRALARCKRNSNRRNKARAHVARLHRKIANTRTTWLHQQSARLIRDYDLIAIEDLNVKGMARSNLSKSIHDASWSSFANMLSYKAEKAGSTLVKVNPKLTSQTCSSCGSIVKKTLAERTHSCPECGLVLDRDHNAAVNILRLGVLAQGVHNVAGCGERAPEKLMEMMK